MRFSKDPRPDLLDLTLQLNRRPAHAYARHSRWLAQHHEYPPATYPDGTTDDLTRAFDVLADAAAAPRSEE